MDTSILKTTSDLMSVFDDVIVQADSKGAVFVGLTSDYTTVGVVAIVAKGIAKKTVKVGIDMDKFSICKEFGSAAEFSVSESQARFQDSKSVLAIPCNEPDKEILEIADKYFQFADFKDIKSVLTKMVELRKEGTGEEVSVLETFKIQPEEIKKLVKFASKFRDSKLSFVGDGAQLIMKASDANLNSFVESKIGKTENTFEQGFASKYFGTMAKNGEFDTGLFHVDGAETDSPAILFHATESLKVIMVVSSQIEEEKEEEKEDKDEENEEN